MPCCEVENGVLTQDDSLEGSGNVVILKGSGPVRRSFLGTSPSVTASASPAPLFSSSTAYTAQSCGLHECVEHVCVHSHIPM